MESWRFITSHSVKYIDICRYTVSNLGRVYDTENKRFLSEIIDDEGYHRVYVHTSTGFKLLYIHRIVKIEFDGYDKNPEKSQVDHVDCIKSHNYPSNLEWVTKSENARRGIKNNLYPQISQVISEDDAHLICQMLKNGMTYKYISDSLLPKCGQDITRIIGKIYRGESWKHVSSQYMPFPKLNVSERKTSSYYLSEEIVEDICKYLDSGHGISETARYIEQKYSINRDLENTVGFIKRGRSWRNISSKYSFIKKEVN